VSTLVRLIGVFGLVTWVYHNIIPFTCKENLLWVSFDLQFGCHFQDSLQSLQIHYKLGA